MALAIPMEVKTTMDTWQRGTITTLTPRWDAGTAGNGTADQMGRVRIARRVLRTAVREAALSVPGVVRFAEAPAAWGALVGHRRPAGGIGLLVHGTVVGVDLYLVTEAGVNMVTVGEAVQEAVAAAIEHILSMTASEINVYIRDVA
jgi:uncharacterized alkaline shock family protein YloU